jgi:hypothetical protein
VLTAPRATAPAIAMTAARFIVSLFMIISSRFCAPSLRRQISRSSPLTQRGTLLENEDERAKCRGSGSFTHSTGRGAVTLMLLIAARTHFSSLSYTYNFEKVALPKLTCEPPYRSARPPQFGLSGCQRDVAYWHFASFRSAAKIGRYWGHSGHWSAMARNASVVNDPERTFRLPGYYKMKSPSEIVW